jgi:hypothetical protein
MVQLVDALRHKPEGRGFDFRWCHLNFLSTYSFQLLHGPKIDPSFNRNEYQWYLLGVEGGRCVGPTLPPPSADCLEVWQLQPSGALSSCSGVALPIYIAFQKLAVLTTSRESN